MIKVNNGRLDIRGDSLTIETELASIIHFMLVDKVLPKKDIERAIAIAFMSEEEIDKELNKKENDKNDFKKELENILNELFD